MNNNNNDGLYSKWAETIKEEFGFSQKCAMIALVLVTFFGDSNLRSLQSQNFKKQSTNSFLSKSWDNQHILDAWINIDSVDGVIISRAHDFTIQNTSN
jgi:hypothetical protein